ncbi:hypothetical protein [Dactylosporangium sp. CS-033363]|uniref:hypothetical protein n=1 Tax=Dactylosporangium sp. CS-033363 TaxID=3239935 RepID=UPI003D9449C5
MELIASADVAADNILDYSVSPAAQAYVIAEHIVRIPRCQVLAVGSLSNVQPPDYPFPGVPSAPRYFSTGAHVYVSLQDGATGKWDYTVAARAESNDCRAVGFRVFVHQGWAGGVGLIFRTGIAPLPYGQLVQEHYRIVFDAITGIICYTATTSRSGKPDDDGEDPDEYAIRAARDFAPDGVQLRVRSLDRPLPPGRHFRVDPASGSVIEVQQRPTP